jgi:hypothetical protein
LENFERITILTNMNYKFNTTVWLLFFFLIINLHSFAQLNPLLPPGGNFDLSAWKIHTLDTNYKYIEVYSAQLVSGYTSKWFYTNPADGSIVFKVPSNGQPTTTASYPRVELRQMTQGANWLLSDTTEHYLEAQCKVITVASAVPKTIIGQIHGSDTVSQILKLRWAGMNPGQCYIDAQFKTNDWNKTDYTIKLITGLSLGDLISYKISMKAGKITVNINDHVTSYTYSSTYYGTTDKYYFKAGNYLQYASSDPLIYGLVQFYRLSLKPTVTLNLKALIQGLSNGTTMIPDTVTVELHNSIYPYSPVEARKGILDSSGNGTFIFSNATAGAPYYIVVKHRNGLETWSAAPQRFSLSSLTIKETGK